MRRAVAALAGLAALGVFPALAADPATAFSGERAMGDIRRLLEFTPRSIGKPGHAQTIDYILDTAGDRAEVRRQNWRFEADDGRALALTNVIVRLNPENPRRIIAATHYDSIVRAYRDAERPHAAMPGANNSASGVAVLLETLRAIVQAAAKPRVGVDFIFFDGEEGQKSLGAGDRNWFALGSPYFVRHLRELYPRALPEHAVVFDMVCYRKAVLQPETGSLAAAPKDVDRFWGLGARNAPGLFSPTSAGTGIGDDHTALNTAGIPSILVIGWKYEPWFNTTQDTLDKCSADTLSGVGRTLIDYIYAQ